MMPAALRRSEAPAPLRWLGLGVALAFAFPAIYLVYRNFSEGADPGGLLLSSRTLEPLWRTTRLATAVSLSAMVLGTSLAWLTTRTDLPWVRFWRFVLPIPLVFPTFIGAAAFIRALSTGGIANDFLSGVGIERTWELRGFSGAWLVLTLFTYPYVYLPVAARLRYLPGTLEENARVLGDSAVATFRRICLLQIASSVGAGTLLVFLYTISDFGAVQLMRYDTLTRALYTNQLRNRPVALALSLILLVFAAVVVIAERRVSARLPDAASVRAGRPMIYELGRWRWPSFGLAVLAIFLSVGAPMMSIVDWAVDGLRRSARGENLTFDADKVIEATTNTLQASVIAAIAAVLVVLPIAYLVGRYRSRSGAMANTLIISTFALPGLLIALSMRFWTLQSDLASRTLGDTMALLTFAYVVRFGSLAMGVTLVAVRSVPDRFHDVARSLGAGRVRRLFTIDVPIMAPGLAAGAGLVLLSVMKELPISLLVGPIGFATLATRTFLSFQDSFVAEAGIMALVLVLLSAIPTWFLVIRRAEHL